MFDKIIAYSIQNKLVIGLLVVALMVWGLFSIPQLSIDAVPDITNNQVQVITTSPELATQEVEQFITTPIELALQNIQQLIELRSISRYGLSVITVVFAEDMDIYLARQLVNEHLQEAAENIPPGLGTPEMAPISTGLGEIYQYVVRPAEGYEDQYSLSDLRSIQDWIIKRQLAGVEGVVEINTLGGQLKQYEVALDPDLLKAMQIRIEDVYQALQQSNENTGGAYIEKNPNTYYIRTDGMARSLADIENIVVDVRNSTPILIKDVATVQFGTAPRFGAVTRDGAEVVGGTAMLLKGANSAAVTERIKERVVQIQKSLPEGVVIEPYLVRDKLISTAIGTVQKNLIEGGLIVVFILVLMLGNWRAGLIVASVIPLAMLFAIAMMNVLGISANLMSLGAIDFGLIVDGAVIIVESVVHRLQVGRAGQKLTQLEMDQEVQTASMQIRKSAAFGEIIILIVYIPILALVGIEGKMFRPMAQTVMLAIGGALVLSLTYVPMMSALFLNKHIQNKRTIADRIIGFFQRLYTPVLDVALRLKSVFVLATVALFVLSMIVFSRMGGEFIPTLEEGDLALHQILPPGSALAQSVDVSKVIQQKLLAEFPEIEDVVTKIGSSEIPTDPMPVETGDIIVIMKPKAEWTSAATRQEMYEKLEETLLTIPGVAYEFSQPIQMRFNELMTGSRADIAIKLYGEDLDVLYAKAKEAEALIRNIEGVSTTKVDQTVGMPQISVQYRYDKLAQYGLQVGSVNQVIRTAFAGEKAGVIYEGDRRFDLVLRLKKAFRQDISNVEDLYIPLPNGSQVPLAAVADVELVDAPMQISRENTNRRIVIGTNVGRSDVESVVENIQAVLEANIDLPPGYYFTYGGQFENLKAGNARLLVAVPMALALIFILLFFTFQSVWQAALIFTAIPLSAIGGIWALQLRDMPFSISAGVGFIALFGVAVLNGIVLIGYFNQLKKEGMHDIVERIKVGTRVRLRPVLMTATVASLGFLPMALSNSGGAEVQRPLATVVIGGLLTATFLTLIILPILYSWLARWQEGGHRAVTQKGLSVIIPFLLCSMCAFAQPQPLSLETAVQTAVANHPSVQAARSQLEQGRALQRLPYRPGRTNLSYNGEALYRDNSEQMHQIRLVQNFENPATVRAQNSLQDQRILQYELQGEWTERALRLQVQQLYLQLQERKEVQQMYRTLLRMYDRFYQMAEAQVVAGATNRLEVIQLQSSRNEFLLLQQQTELQIQNLETRLAGLLQSEEPVTTADSLVLLSHSPQGDARGLAVQLAEQELRLAQAQIGIIAADRKPDFNIGYAAQHFFSEGWLSGVQIGVNFSLFNRQNKQRVEAQQLQTVVAQAQVQTEQMELEQRLLSLQNSIELYAAGVAYYRSQIEVIHPELARLTTLNYQAGELSYLDLLNTLQRLAQNEKNYWQQLLSHNQAVVQYQFLIKP